MGVTEFDFTVDPKKPITNEIASAATDYDVFQGFLEQIPNPDEVLRLECGGDITVYDAIGRDPRISANLGIRARAVVAREWGMTPFSQETVDIKAAEYTQKVFLGFAFDLARRSILRGGSLKGFAVSEVMWDYSEGDTFILDMRYRHQRRFDFNRDRHLLLKTLANPLGENVTVREGLPLKKFQHVMFGDEVETPWGIGLGRELYWPWWFKKNDIKSWLMHGDKFAGPTVVGEYEPGAPEVDQNKLLAAAQAVHSRSAIIHPKGMLLRLMEAARNGSAGTYRELVEFLNDEITICILGQTATTQGTPGKLGNDTAQENVRLDLVKADADSLCEAFNARDTGVIRWLVDYQFPGLGRYPQMWIDCEEEEDKKTLAERDDKLTSAMDKSGLRLKSSYYIRVHGIQEDEIEEKPASVEATAGKPAAVEFAERLHNSSFNLHPSSCPHCQGLAFADDPNGPKGGDPDAVDQIAGQALETADGSDLIAAIRKHIEQSRDLPAALDTLPDLRRGLDIKPAAEALAQAAILANLTGRAEVMDEVSGSNSELKTQNSKLLSFAEGVPLPFDEAIAFFRQKLNFKSETWTDLWQGEHSRQFTVAGVMRDDQLADFRAAIDSAIADGATHAAFLQEFDAIVERYGWSYKGNRGWRSRVIYDTNVRTAYNAGRWAQLTDPDLLQVNPYLEYRHGDSKVPRLPHLAWNGITLPATDPWWKTHYTPNGWG